MDGISKDTFEKLDIEGKLMVMFDLHKECADRIGKLSDQVDALRQLALKWGGAGGIIAGIGAYLATLFIGHLIRR